ncbi:MAG: sulfite exporter TauE/SafE family protein [Actinomycetota bacterium]|nr:sulfite exporter TauE/SafE family protein [Actinomycetota bacterium]
MTTAVTGADLSIAAAVAAVAGVINSVAGGGSLVLFPTLIGLGLPTVSANVTNSVTQWPGYLGGVVGFRRQLAGHRRRIVTLSVAALAGGATGSVLLLTTPSDAFDIAVPVFVLLASLLLAVQPALARRLSPAASRGQDPSWMPVVVFTATVYGGYFGGALGVVLLGVLGMGLGDLHLANALKTVLSLVTATVAAVLFSVFGPVAWPYLVVCAPASLLGGVARATVATRVPARPLRSFIVAFGVAAAAFLFQRA